MESLPTFFDDAILDEYEEAMEVTGSCAVASSAPPVEPPAVKADFTHSKAVEIEVVDVANGSTSNGDTPSRDKESDPKVLPKTKNLQKPNMQCNLCKKQHPLRACFRFRGLAQEKRLRHVLLHGCCSRCLSSNHATKDCLSTNKCWNCQGDHHKLLCSPNQKAIQPQKKVKNTNKNSVSRSVIANSMPSTSVLRHVVNFSPTLQAKLIFGNRKIQIRAVIDLCCQMSYISDHLVKQLNIPVVDAHVRLIVGSIYDDAKRISITAKVKKMHGIKTPIENVSADVRGEFPGFQYADPSFFHSGQVALVLGPDVSSKVITGRTFASPGSLLAQYTMFGWVVSGTSPI